MPTIKRVAAGFAAIIASGCLSLAATTALAAPTDAPTASIPDCAAQGGVFVIVTQEDGTSAGACVDKPSTGTAALEAAGVTITRDATGMICALDKHPDPCPTTFDGKYWQYYQASADDAVAGKWTFASTGSDDTKPQAGWVEGWCYGAECTPKMPIVALGGNSPTTTAPAPPASRTGLIIGIVAAVVVIAALAMIVAQSRRRTAGSVPADN